MQTNIFPRTFNAGVPHVVATSTSGRARPIDSTVLKLLPRGILGVILTCVTFPAARSSTGRGSKEHALDLAGRDRSRSSGHFHCHGAAHGGANVPLSAAANLFLFVVILAGPLAGLALTWRSARIGSGLIALTMAGALVFGVVNHFVFASPDHVAHVDAAWRPLFAATAVLLALTEALGCALAIGVVRERKLS